MSESIGMKICPYCNQGHSTASIHICPKRKTDHYAWLNTEDPDAPKALRARVSELEAELTTAKRERDNERNLLCEEEHQGLTLEAECNDLRAQLAAATERAEKAEAKLHRYEATPGIAKEYSRLDAMWQEMVAERDRLRAELTESRAFAANERAERDRLRGIIGEIAKPLGYGPYSPPDRIIEAIQQLAAKRDRLRAELETAKEERDDARQSVVAGSTQLQEMSADLEMTEKQLAAANAQIEALRGALEPFGRCFDRMHPQIDSRIIWRSSDNHNGIYVKISVADFRRANAALATPTAKSCTGCIHWQRVLQPGDYHAYQCMNPKSPRYNSLQCNGCECYATPTASGPEPRTWHLSDCAHFKGEHCTCGLAANGCAECERRKVRCVPCGDTGYIGGMRCSFCHGAALRPDAEGE